MIDRKAAGQSIAKPRRLISLRWILPIGVVAASGFWGYSLHSQRHAMGSGELIVEAAHLDFGEAWVRKDFRWTLPVRNIGERSLEVREIRGSCRCTSVEPERFTLEPGETRHLTVSIDLRPRTPQQASAPVRDFSVTLSPLLTTGSLTPPRWRITGRVRNPLRLSPHAVNLQLMRGGPLQSQTVTLTPNVPLAHVKAACPSSLATVRVRHENGKYLLRIVPSLSASARSGPFSFDVTLSAVGEDGRHFSPIPLSVSGRILDDVRLTPPVLAFGTIVGGETSSQTVVLSSRTGTPFQLDAVDHDEHSGLKITRLPDGAGASHNFAAHHFLVAQRAVDVGPHVAEVRFLTRHADSDEPIETVLRVLWHGTADTDKGDHKVSSETVQ